MGKNVSIKKWVYEAKISWMETQETFFV